MFHELDIMPFRQAKGVCALVALAVAVTSGCSQSEKIGSNQKNISTSDETFVVNSPVWQSQSYQTTSQPIEKVICDKTPSTEFIKCLKENFPAGVHVSKVRSYLYGEGFKMLGVRLGTKLDNSFGNNIVGYELDSGSKFIENVQVGVEYKSGDHNIVGISPTFTKAQIKAGQKKYNNERRVFYLEDIGLSLAQTSTAPPEFFDNVIAKKLSSFEQEELFYLLEELEPPVVLFEQKVTHLNSSDCKSIKASFGTAVFTNSLDYEDSLCLKPLRTFYTKLFYSFEQPRYSSVCEIPSSVIRSTPSNFSECRLDDGSYMSADSIYYDIIRRPHIVSPLCALKSRASLISVVCE